MDAVPPGAETPAPRSQHPTDGADGCPHGPALEAVTAKITEISTLPDVALRVMQVASDPGSDASDLRSVLESDPALCVRVLRCVNSAAYGLRTTVDDLNQAVSYLGFNQIRDLAITATVSDLFRGTGTIGTYDRHGLWRHMVASGVAARMIAVRLRLDGHANAFLGGLLHDVGIILFDQYRHEEFKRVVAGLHAGKSLPDFERKLVPWDHTELGFAMGTKWRLPEFALAAIRWHHDPDTCPPPHTRLVHCVALANAICSSQGISSVGTNLVGVGRATVEALGIEFRDVPAFAEDLEGEFERNRHLFEIVGG